MDPKLLLVKIITLLYRESQLENNTGNSAQLARSVLATIKLPENTMDTDRGREVLVGLRSTALWMIDNPVSQKYDKVVMLQRIRVNVGEDEGLYEAFVSGFEDISDENVIKKHILEYRDTLNSHIKHGRVEEVLKEASQKVLFRKETVDWNNFVRDVIEQLEPLAKDADIAHHPAIVDQVDLSEIDQIERLMNQAQEEIATDGIIKLGWQGINRMTGDHDGIRRGEMVLVGALQHNFKTGFTLNAFKQACLYNVPYMRDPNKIPLNVHLSLENNLLDNIMQLYVSLKENETGELVDIRSVDTKQAAAYVNARLQETGYKIKMLRVDPSEFGFRDLFDLVTKWESEGYEIHFLVCDYLNMMSKRGCQQGPAGFEVRDLFRRTRNFMSPRGIAFMTPHQLSSEAKSMVRGNIDNFVQEIANKGYYDSCRLIDQEVDLEFNIHIEKVQGEKWLTIQRGKHRKISITPEKDLYCVYKFQAVAGIPDDVNGEDLSLRKICGSKDGGGGDNWWS